MGVITAAVGGIIRDVLGQEPSIILRREAYVTASLLGAIVFTALVATGVERLPAAAIGGYCPSRSRARHLTRLVPSDLSRQARPGAVNARVAIPSDGGSPAHSPAIWINGNPGRRAAVRAGMETRHGRYFVQVAKPAEHQTQAPLWVRKNGKPSQSFSFSRNIHRKHR